jgi:hypothetical protein
MPDKTEAELLAIAELAKNDASYEDFPGDVTWEDLEEALKLAAIKEAKANA